MQTLDSDLLCQSNVWQGAPSDDRSKQIPSTRPHPSLKQDINPGTHSKQIPSTRPHPSLKQDVNQDVHSKQIPSIKPHLTTASCR